jgi:cell division septum initiation protein DivIVA
MSNKLTYSVHHQHRKETMNNPPMEAQAFAKWLNEHGACRESLKWQHGKTLREIWDTCQRGDWLEWLLTACGYQWKAPAWAEYQRVTATARAEYQRVTATALAEYERVKATARAEYERVTDTAWAEYERVKADTIRTLIPYPFK